jgi:transposase
MALTRIRVLHFVLRFQKSRDIGCHVSLRPRRSASGQSQPQLRITKEGDPYLRTILVQGPHYIISCRGPDTDLKRWGLHLARHGGKLGKKRAIVAVARKLGRLRAGSTRAIKPPSTPRDRVLKRRGSKDKPS